MRILNQNKWENPSNEDGLEGEDQTMEEDLEEKDQVSSLVSVSTAIRLAIDLLGALKSLVKTSKEEKEGTIDSRGWIW